jgi:hypothetical protein
MIDEGNSIQIFTDVRFIFLSSLHPPTPPPKKKSAATLKDKYFKWYDHCQTMILFFFSHFLNQDMCIILIYINH